LHSDILKNSQANLFHHNKDTIWASQKSMLINIDCMIDYGWVNELPQSCKNIWWHGKVCPRFEIENIAVDHVWPTHPTKRRINWFAAFTGRKKKAEPRLKGYAG
jgi:hypothetical protein